MKVRHPHVNLSNLDSVRVALSLYLAISHVVPSVSIETSENGSVFFDLIAINSYATGVFFVISGFLLSLHVTGSAESAARFDRRRFMMRRLTALYPIHLVSLLAMLILQATSRHGLAHVDVFISTNPWVQTTDSVVGATPLMLAGNVLLQLTLMHAWNPFELMFNTPSWSISALLFFYMVFALAAPRLRTIRRPGPSLAATVLVCFVMASIGYHFADSSLTFGIIHRNPLVLLPEFVSGLFLWLLLDHGGSSFRLSRGHLILCLAVATASPLLCAVLHRLVIEGRVDAAIFFLCHSALLLPGQIALVAAAVALPQIGRSWAMLPRLGRASLSIYALHIPLWAVVGKLAHLTVSIAAAIVSGGDADLIQAGDDAWHIPPWLIVPYLVLLVVVSVAFQERIVPVLSRLFDGVLLRGSAALSRPRRRTTSTGDGPVRTPPAPPTDVGETDATTRTVPRSGLAAIRRLLIVV